MAIATTYRNILIDEYIKEQLQQGNIVTSQDLVDRLNTLIATLDLSLPQFEASSSYVTKYSSSSASSIISTFTTIKKDIRALYKDMLELTKVNISSVERWRLEMSLLEKRLIDLEEVVDNLIIVISDVTPSQGIVVDNFTDLNLVEKTITDAEVNIQAGLVKLQKNNTSFSRILLNDLVEQDDLQFKIRTNSNYISRIDAENASLIDPFKQDSSSWWTSVLMSKSKPVTCEYTVRLSSSFVVDISRIFIDLHDSVESGPLSITPLLSRDGVNFTQLNSVNFTQEVRDTATFTFPTINTQWVKFIIVKQGPDLSSTNNREFSYQFGFKEISFFNESFETTSPQQLYSKPLAVLNSSGDSLDFEKISLETCELIEPNTDIKYYMTTSNDSAVTVDASTVWNPISPVNRANPRFPTVLTIGDINTVEFNGISIDDDADQAADNFFLLSEDTSGDVVASAESTTTIPRYTYKTNKEKILNYQIKDQVYTGSGETAITINNKTLQLFRNVGEQGLDPTVTSNQVREIQRGWGFTDPYYTCVIEIQNPEGITIDFGDTAIWIDDLPYKNVVNNTVLTGKTDDNTGIHRIKVHKTKWKHVTPNLNTLTDLKVADPLYPYNHKMLIEGYSYGTSYPSSGEKLYCGADIFAEFIMRQTNAFDIYNNIADTNYQYFAFDKDVSYSHTSSNSLPTKVFLLKVNNDIDDYINERFFLRFTRINQLKKYLRLRADFSTNDTSVTPVLHAYKIKLG